MSDPTPGDPRACRDQMESSDPDEQALDSNILSAFGGRNRSHFRPTRSKAKRRFGVATLVIAAAFVAACVVSFMLVAIGFGHRG
ncbi:MAG TPA: hypothetical protein VN113_03285 [Caulobacter sp.]|nr:hypothetical protein [Caulobacter sp.]